MPREALVYYPQVPLRILAPARHASANGIGVCLVTLLMRRPRLSRYGDAQGDEAPEVSLLQTTLRVQEGGYAHLPELRVCGGRPTGCTSGGHR